MKTPRSILMAISLGVSACTGSPVVPIGDQPVADCPKTQSLVEQALPRGVGDPSFVQRLLRPEIDRAQLSDRFDVQSVQEVLDDEFEIRESTCETRPSEP